MAETLENTRRRRGPAAELDQLPLFDAPEADTAPRKKRTTKKTKKTKRTTKGKAKAKKKGKSKAKGEPKEQRKRPAGRKAKKKAPPTKASPRGAQAVNTSDDSAETDSGAVAYKSAQSIASRQRDISVSEFFAKNRHMLGFDSPSRAILTTVKEALDNSLDACEEAHLPPDIRVEITELSETRYRVVVEDSGPGIVKAQVPRIFGKLLYGSKFHELKQTRGQQGIGISAAVMYSQLTTGKPVKVTTRTGRGQAHLYELQIDTKKNAPVVLDEGEVDWEHKHGTRVEMEIEATYKKGRRSVDAHIHQTALANPHADIRYIPPRGEPVHYTRLTSTLPPEPVAIKPHPHGVELGVLMEMLQSTKQRTVSGFLTTSFSRMSPRTAKEIVESAGLTPRTNPKRVKREQAEAIVRAFATARIMKPPTNCLSAIGEELLVKSLEREFEAGFYTALTRPPAVYRGNPFQVEVGMAWGVKDMTSEDTVQLFRFANRAPLIYQQSACAITQSVIGTGWKSYGVQQSRGALPAGPLVIMVQIASVWVPFTSESKEAIAHYPEMIKEIKLAVQECGRRLGRYIRKGIRVREEEKKRSYIEQYIPHIGIALQEILGFSEREEQKIVEKLKDTLERSRKM